MTALGAVARVPAACGLILTLSVACGKGAPAPRNAAVRPSAAPAAPVVPAIKPVDTWTIETDRIVSSTLERLVGARASANGVVVIDAEHTYLRPSGYRHLEPRKPFTESTRFEIGSVSKIFAGLLLAEAVGRGEVRFSDVVSRDLPDLPVADYRGTPVTLLDVASQSVGFPLMPDNWRSRKQDLSGPPYTLALLREYLGGFQHPFRPGTGYSYSNVNTSLLAMALSHRLGKPYDNLLRERIFEPLGMRSSDFSSRPPETDDVLQGWAEGQPFLPRIDDSPLAPCCSVRTTLPDIARFMRAAAGEPNALRRSFEDLGEPRRRIDDHGDAWATLGWIWRPRAGILWKNGVHKGQRCSMVVQPGRGRGVFAIVNDESVDPDTVASALVMALFGPQLDLDAANHARFVVPSVPPEATATQANFGDVVQAVAWTAPARLHPGETGRLRFYFRSLAAADRDWQIFVHMDRSGAKRPRIPGDHYPGRAADSVLFWKPGETIVDEFDVTVPGDAETGTFDVWFGFYEWSARLPVVSATTRVDENRVLGPRLVIEAAPKKRSAER